MANGRVAYVGPSDISSVDEDAISPRPLESPSDISMPYPASSISTRSKSWVVQQTAISIGAGIAFAKLTPEVIKLILWLSDSNTFASLVFLNRQWNTVSQDAALYAHHLSRCPSFALSHDIITGSSRLNDLKWLKVKFAQEVRRNLFDAFMRPSETLVNLISTNASSSAAFPRGEALRFIFSSHGQTLLALSSSRIFVVNLWSEPLAVTRELKTMRRPLSAAVTNDGSLLAVLSTKHQANVYGLTATGVTYLQVIILDNPPRTISLASEGTVLAAAYEGGVEVFSLAANALSTDRRAVRCEAVDSLAFSVDGSMLIGSSHDVEDSNTVVITAPFYTENDPNLTTRDLHSRMWTTQILFPQNSSTCSHAALLNSHAEGDIGWLFVYDRSLNTYRAVRADDTRTGVAYFLGPDPQRHSLSFPSLLPTINLSGELAVAGFLGVGLFLYGVPERLDNAPDMSHVLEREERSHRRPPLPLTSATGYREPLMAYSPPVSDAESMDDDFLSGTVDWRQSLFVRSRQLPSFKDAVSSRWVENLAKACNPGSRRRLAVVAPGGVSEFAEEIGEEVVPVDGGRILLLDFDYAPHGKEKRTVTIEVGEKTPEILPEQRGNLDVEVALARRRSTRERVDGSRRLSLGRSATAIIPQFGRLNTHAEDIGSRGSISQPSSPLDASRSPDAMFGSGNRSPPAPERTREHLQRSVTATGLGRARYPPRPPLDSAQGATAGQVVYRRSNEVRALPHHGEVDDWEPPPPYTRSPDRSLPTLERFQMTPRNFSGAGRRQSPGETYISPVRVSTAPGGVSPPPPPPPEAFSNARNLSDGTDRLRRGMSVSNVEAWAYNPAQNLRRRSEYFSSIQSLTSSASPTWAANTHTAGRQPSEQSFGLAANILSPMHDVALPQRSAEEIGAHYDTRSGVSSELTSPASLTGGPSTTLTGANLQNRLNHPVPPRPSQTSQETSQMYFPSPLQVGNRAPNPQLSSNSNSEPFSLAPPTPDQMANLNRRVSDIRRRPVPISTAGHHAPNVSEHDFAPAPPSPPRAAWGAAGIPGSPSFNKAMRSPQGLSRPSSRNSQRSASTPNLPIPRPRYDRLDTIESVTSVYPQPERSRSRSQGMLDRPYPLDSVPAPAPRAETHPKPIRSRKQRRAQRIASGGSDEGRKKKAARCIVM